MTKKLLSILLAVLMVMTYVTPAMALPLDLNPLEEVVEGGEAAEPVDEVEEPVDEVDAIVPGADIQAKPSKLSASVVQRMKIQANAVSGTKTGSCQPSQGAKLLSYTIGDVVGSDEEGWTTTVTFHFQSGDKFEASAANTFSGLSTFKGCEGNWVYYFNETHPADQTITLYRDGKAWAYYSYSGALTKIKSSGNINIGHLIQVDMRLDTELPKSYTVTYTDGVEGEEIFADQTYTVEENKATPAFNGELTREGYEFAGWQPEVAATVTADVTYTAQWKVESNNVARLESDGSEYTTIAAAIKAANNAATMTEGHPAQTVTILKNTTESVNYSWGTAASVKWDFNLTIDLNGKTVTGKSGSVFTFTRNCSDKTATSAFYVTFNDSVGTGVVTGGNNPNGKGGAINVISKNGHAKLTINGGTYKGNTAQRGGAIATYENSTDYGFDVEINGGLITENTASDIGGGIYAYNAISRVVVNGGEIVGNTATNAGDDIAFASKNSLGSKYESLLKLQNSSWYHDKSGSRYSASNAVAFTQWNGYTTQGKNNMVYLKYVEPTYVYVTYEDGLNNTVFAKEDYKVVAGSATPAFTGSTERAGYKFVGWQPALAEKATEDVTYVAQWELLPTYKLTFNGNGANKLSGTISGSHTSKTRYTEGTNVNLNTAMDGKKFTKELSADYSTNYRQTGWNTKADGTGDHYAMNGTFVMPAYDVTLYAEWESYEWIHWNVQMSEGGDHINYTTKYMGPKADVQSFKAYTGNVGTSYGKVPAAYYTPVKAVAKEGYRFIGWYDVAKNECISTNDTLYGKDFEALRALTLAESGAVLEARFEAKKASNIHVVIYKASDLTKPVVSKAVTNLYDGDTFTPNIADYYSSANGYEFVGWFNDGNFNQYKAGKNYTEATEFTVTGAWQNVIAVVTDYEKVVVKAVYDGDKANAKTVYSGLALRGTNVIEYLEANAGVGEVEGYTLDKWYNWDWYGHKVAENATVNGWTNVYVTYTRNIFTVTYTDGVNGAAFADESHTAKYEDATPAFEGSLDNYIGWVFNGWNPKVADKVTEDVTYTAKWRMKGANTVIYYGNEGVRSNGDTFWSEYTNAQTKVLGSNTGYYEFTRTGWHFTGWNTKADGTGDAYAAGATYTFTAAHNLETVELYAQWERNTYTVKYVDGVNGAAFADESHTAKYEDATPAFEGSLDNYIGWVFNGWNPKVSDKVTEDVTYTAKWKMKGANTVIYYGNEGVRSNGDTFWSEYTNAQTQVLGSNTGYYEFARTGWHFTGWNTKADGTGDAYAAGATYTFTAAHNLETVKLYAQWERNTYTVKYVDGVNGVAFADESHTAKYEDATPAFEGSLDNYIGWVFNGWNPKVADKVTEDVTYTAKWRMKGANTVIYYGNEGVRSNGDTFWSEYTNAQTKVLGSNTGYYEFTRTGWHFTGWNTKADGTGDAYAAGATYTFTAAHNLETVKLYAQWEANTYTVSFNCNGGEACAPITVTYGEAYGRQLPACFVDGMQNLGWYLVDAEGNVTDISIGERTLVTEARDHQLFQKREIKTPTVKLNLSRPVYNYLEKPVTIQSSGITEYPALKYSYQWYKDGTALTDGKIYEGSNTANLTLKHDYVSCSGLYKLVVTISVADNSGIVSANGTVTAENSYDLLIRRSSNMVIYDANGGQGGPLNDSDYYDKANDRYIAKLRGVDGIPNSPLVRKGYHFLGWNTKADGTGDSYKPGDFYVFDRELSENGGLRVTLYAMWEACADHLVDVKVLKAPTCTEKGLKLCRCKVCGVEYEVEMPALGHDLSGWIWNRTEHWKKCRRCGELFEVDKHTLTEWKDILRNGEIVPEHHCVVCGFSECGSVIHIDGTKKPQAGVEVNPPTGAEVPSLLPALAVLAGAAVLLRKKK